MALGPPRHHLTISPPLTRYTPPGAHVLTQRGSYNKKISSLRALHPDLGPISTSLLTDIAHDDAIHCISPSFVLDHQGNCLALVQSTLDPHITFSFTALNNSLSVSAIGSSCTPPRSSPMLVLATILGPSLLGISVAPLRSALTSDQSAASTAEHTLVAVRSEYRVNIYRIAVSYSSAFTLASTHPFAAAQLLDSIDFPHRCTRICASPFSASEVLISTAGGVYLWRDSSPATKRLKLVLTEIDMLRLIDPALAKQREEAQEKTKVERVTTRRSNRRSRPNPSIPPASDPDLDPDSDSDPSILAPAESHVTCTWSPSPRFTFLHTSTTAYRVDVRAEQPSATLEQLWAVPTASQALPAGTPLPAPVTIQHMTCDPRSDTLILAAGPRLVLIDAREPVRVGVLANLGWGMSRELGVHMLDPISLAGAGGALVLATSSILHHTTHLVPISIDTHTGGGASAIAQRRFISQPMLPRLLPKLKQATPANEWAHGLRTVERVKHVEYPQDAPMVGCAIAPVRTGGALVVVQAFADGCVLAREVPVVSGVGAVKGSGDEDATAAVAEQLAEMHIASGEREERLNPPMPVPIKYHGRKIVVDLDEKLRALVVEAAKGGVSFGTDESSVLSAGDFGDDGLARLKALVGFTPDDDWDLAQVFPRDQMRADVRRIAAIAQQVRKACQPPPTADDEDGHAPGHLPLLKSSILRAAVKDKSKLDSIEWSTGTEALAGKWTEMIAAAAATFTSAPSPPPPPSQSGTQGTAASAARSRASAPLFSLGSKITKRGPPALSSSQQHQQLFPPFASQPVRPAPRSSQLPGFANASQQPHASRVSAPLSFFSQQQPASFLPPPPTLSQQSRVADSGSWSQQPPPSSQPLTGRRSMALSFDFGFGSTSASASLSQPPPSQMPPNPSSHHDSFGWAPASASQLSAATLPQQHDLPAQSQDSLGPMPSMSQPAYASRLSQGTDIGFGGMSLTQPAGQPPRKRKRTQGF